MTVTALGLLLFAACGGLVVFFRMRLPALLTFVVLAGVAYARARPQVFLAFLLAFLFIALAKLVTRLATGSSDVARWSPANFLYSAGPPVAAVVVASWVNHAGPWELAALAGLAVVVSDTASAEAGATSGRTAYLITSGRSVPPGTDGAVSVLGSLAGLAWSATFGLLALAIYPGVTLNGALAIAGLGMLGNALDSLLGATLQHAGRLTNEQVNGASVTAVMALAGAAAAVFSTR